MREKMENAVEKSMVTVSKFQIIQGAEKADTVGCKRLVEKNQNFLRVR